MTPAAKVDRVDEIGADRVRHVALLSRLSLTDEAVGRYARELSGVIKHLNKLAELDLDGVAPTSHPMAIANVFREDAAVPGLTTAEALSNAPESDADCFKVPQII